MDNIKENLSVILQKDKVLKAIKLECGKKVVFEKLHFKIDNALGHPFGTWFEVSGNQLQKVNPNLTGDETENGLNSTPIEVTPTESVDDNRLLVDTHGKSQSLKREEIIQMKAMGAKGEEIVESIMKNSTTFTGKTIYSQKKYLKKKKLKHLNYIRIMRPSARLICKMYESREPVKICHMTLETMSQVLTMSNVHHGSRVAVVETCSGILLGLVMQRLGGKGAVINLHAGETPANFHAIKNFNFSEDYWAMLHSLPLCRVGPLLAHKTFEESVGEIPSETDQKSEIKTSINEGTNLPSHQDSSETERIHSSFLVDDETVTPTKALPLKTARRVLTEEEKCQIRLERKNKRLRHQYCAWNLLKSRNLDALIVSCKYHPTPLVLTLLEFLAPSRPFVIYCETREPLMELFVQLSFSSKAVNVKLFDTFMRQYQVLPEQTHPKVMMNTSGGFLLTGISIETVNRKTEGIGAKKIKLTMEENRN